MRHHKYQYAVRYRRRDWQWAQVRYYRIASAAHRYAATLLKGGRPDLSPLVELRIERQELGPVELVADYLEGPR